MSSTKDFMKKLEESIASSAGKALSGLEKAKITEELTALEKKFTQAISQIKSTPEKMSHIPVAKRTEVITNRYKQARDALLRRLHG